MAGEPLSREFLLQPTVTVARQLLGMHLMTPLGALMIVETEAYGPADPASHAFRGPSRATAAMFGLPGTAYVHINYGIHHCLNVVCQPEGIAEAVLIRALDRPPFPRPAGAKDEERGARGLYAGPGRLAKTLGMRKETHEGIDLLDPESPVWLAAGDEFPDDAVTVTTRIGITKGAAFPWRFYVTASKLVSHR